MGTHDDYLDLASAWERYDRAYVAWGKLVDGTEKGRFRDGCRDPAKLLKGERRLAKALRRLHNAAEQELHNVLHREGNHQIYRSVMR